MKKIFLIALTTLMLWGGQAMADFVDHPQYAKISTLTESIISQIADAQDEFFIENSRYFQGLWLLGDTQVDGTTDETISENTSPDDFGVTWAEFMPTVFKKKVTLPVNVKIDVYTSPRGWGWILFAEVFYPDMGPDAYGTYGDHWVYRHHEGPDDISGGIFDEWYIEVEGP